MKDWQKPEAQKKLGGWIHKALDPRVVSPVLWKKTFSPYPTFGDRLSAALLDCAWVVLLLGPVIGQIHETIETTMPVEMPQTMDSFAELFAQLNQAGVLRNFLIEQFAVYAMLFPVILCMWMYASATPGKWVLRQRVVRGADLGKPTTKQWCLRYFGYLFVFPGYLWVCFDPKKRAFHDILAGTLVIKVRHWKISEDGSVPATLVEPRERR